MMIDPLKLLLFVVLSAGAVALSLHAWRTQQTYGLFRFFAFEAVVLLIAQNASHWFHEALSIRQIISWAFLAASLALAVHGFYLLRVLGKARERVIEETQTVVELGAYRYIRHPLYASLILFGWGVFFKGADLPSASLALATTAFSIATARYEEGFNIDRFGAAYSEYMKRTKMFIPFLL
jgi:protein-S-isoprenylcysteine O-methyltransferase Ste14